MGLPPFEYLRPDTLGEALTDLSDGRGQVLAGGQSLVAAMNQGTRRPPRLVDVNRVSELGEMTFLHDQLVVGSMVRLAHLRESALVASRAPLIWAALRHVAHVQVRTRATIGGNLSQADPSSELPAVAVALGATFVVRSATGEREIPAAQYAVAPFRTSLEPDELLTQVRFPLTPHVGAGFVEICRKAKDWPVIGAGAQVRLGSDGRVARAWVAVCGAAGHPLRQERVEEGLVGQELTPEAIRGAAQLVGEVEEYPGARAGARYRGWVQPVVVERALSQAATMVNDREAVA